MYLEKSYAKLNLFLLINGKSELNSFYHNINSLFCFTQDIYDTLEISHSLNNKDNLSFKNNCFLSNSIENNIIYKTINYFRLLGYKIPYLNVVLNKQIPIGAGMAGGSANSAALIRFFVKEFGVIINEDILQKIAFNLGADIPACYFSKALFVSSIGEKVTKVNLQSFYVTLINPLVSKSTASFFKEINSFSKPVQEGELKDIDFSKLCLLIKKYGNDFTNIACSKHESVKNILDFIKANKQVGGLTGSGLTCFAVHKNKTQADIFKKQLELNFASFWVKKSIVC